MDSKPKIIHVSFRGDVDMESETYEFIRSEAKRKGMSIKRFLCELVRIYKDGTASTFDKSEIEEIIRKTVKEAGNSTISF